MDERETLISKTTDKATKEAKKQNLNEAQTKLYVDEKVKEALEKYDKQVAETNTESTKQTEKNTEKNTEQKAKSTKQTEKKYIVYTPVKNFCGVIAKVHFAYGKAEVKPGWILNWFKEHGYKVEEVSE